MLKFFDTPNSYRKRHRLQDICWPDLAWRGNAVPIVLVSSSPLALAFANSY